MQNIFALYPDFFCFYPIQRFYTWLHNNARNNSAVSQLISPAAAS